MTFSKKQNGFTLIELITVIAIIMILMGLLLPAFNAAKEAARRAQAHSDVTNIVTAVNAYYTEYGTYPLPATSGSTDAVFGANGSAYTNDQLINVLTCSNTSTWTNPSPNPRMIQFLTANNVKTPKSPTAGLATQSTNTASDGATINAGAYIDPWGNPYVIIIDAPYAGNITQGVTTYYSDAAWQSNAAGVNVGVGACSLGRDGQWGSAGNKTFAGSDDIVSWQ